jgi:hypothetical protein
MEGGLMDDTRGENFERNDHGVIIFILNIFLQF